MQGGIEKLRPCNGQGHIGFTCNLGDLNFEKKQTI